MKNKPTLKKGIVAASVVAGVAGGLVAGLALGVPGFAGASSNGVQGAAATFAKSAVVQVADAATDTNTDSGNATTELPDTITVQGSTDGADHAPRGPRGGMPAADAVAKALGMTAEELRTELRSGKSIADVAKAKGVDIEKVKTAITADLKTHLDAEVASGEHTQAEADAKLAELTSRLDDIVNGVKPAGMPGRKGDHGPRGGAPFGGEAVATALGMTAEELRTELQSGKSIADVAKAKGIDVEKVKTAMLDAFTAKEQAEVASGEHTQAEVDAKIADFKTRLDGIVNGVRPDGMPGGKGGHGPRGDHGPRGGHGEMGGSAPTLQGDVQVQPSGANA